MQYIFLEKEIRKLKKKCEVKKEDLCLLFELITFLSINGEISIYDTERYTYTLFKLLERAREE